MKRAMHPNSLENLKKEKPVNREYGHRYAIPQEKIDEIFSLLIQKNCSLNKVAKATGVHFQTIKKYYQKGDLKRGIEPLRTRVMIYFKRRANKFEDELLKREKDHLQYIRNAIGLINEEIKLGTADYKVSDLARLIKLEREILGANDNGGAADEGLISAEEIRDLEKRSKASDSEGVSQVERG